MWTNLIALNGQDEAYVVLRIEPSCLSVTARQCVCHGKVTSRQEALVMKHAVWRPPVSQAIR